MIKPLTTYRALTRAIELSRAALALIQEGDSETTAARKLHEGGAKIGITWKFRDGKCEITTTHEIDPL